LRGLEAGVHHLHSLGWAHNDVNPANVVVGADGEPAMVDFGSCPRIGDKLGASRGTPGWMENGDEYTTSKESHDIAALDKIRAWLDNPTFK